MFGDNGEPHFADPFFVASFTSQPSGAALKDNSGATKNDPKLKNRPK